MLVRLCDWCKAQIPVDTHYFNLRVSRDDFGESDKVEEICQSCYDAFRNRVTAHVQSKQTEEEPRRRGPAPKPIDIGKAKALRRAGWTLKATAEELKVSTSRLCEVLKKEEEAHAN